MGKPWIADWYDTLGSTNDEVKRLARQGAPEGAAVAAKTQTGGKGRRGRSFQSPAGTGMYFSVLLRPEAPAEDCMHLTCAAAVAAAKGVESLCGITPGIKWPNDLTWGNRKLGGILTEISANDGKVEWAVIGIGINCRTPEGGFPEEIAQIATDLQTASGVEITPQQLCGEILQQLKVLAATGISDRSRWMTVYRKACVTTGKPVQVIAPLGVREAFALEVADDGSLLVEYPDGCREWVNSGEVSVRGMYFYT